MSTKLSNKNSSINNNKQPSSVEWFDKNTINNKSLNDLQKILADVSIDQSLNNGIGGVFKGGTTSGAVNHICDPDPYGFKAKSSWHPGPNYPIGGGGSNPWNPIPGPGSPAPFIPPNVIPGPNTKPFKFPEDYDYGLDTGGFVKSKILELMEDEALSLKELFKDDLSSEVLNIPVHIRTKGDWEEVDARSSLVNKVGNEIGEDNILGVFIVPAFSKVSSYEKITKENEQWIITGYVDGTLAVANIKHGVISCTCGETACEHRIPAYFNALFDQSKNDKWFKIISLLNLVAQENKQERYMGVSEELAKKIPPYIHTKYRTSDNEELLGGTLSYLIDVRRLLAKEIKNMTKKIVINSSIAEPILREYLISKIERVQETRKKVEDSMNF